MIVLAAVMATCDVEADRRALAAWTRARVARLHPGPIGHLRNGYPPLRRTREILDFNTELVARQQALEQRAARCKTQENDAQN